MNDLKRETDLAWAAGIVDGEGCIYRYKGYKCTACYIIELTIAQCSVDGIPEILQRFKNIFQIGSICGPHYYKKYNWRPRYLYKTGSNDTRQILRLIWPYLGTVKRKRAYQAGFRLTTWELGAEHLVKHWERHDD